MVMGMDLDMGLVTELDLVMGWDQGKGMRVDTMIPMEKDLDSVMGLVKGMVMARASVLAMDMDLGMVEEAGMEMEMEQE